MPLGRDVTPALAPPDEAVSVPPVAQTSTTDDADTWLVHVAPLSQQPPPMLAGQENWFVVQPLGMMLRSEEDEAAAAVETHWLSVWVPEREVVQAKPREQQPEPEEHWKAL